jgi:hypothetical protein
MMRPRFSVRVLLVVVSVLAFVCYLLLVRPSVLADQFVAAVNQRDFMAANSLLLHRSSRLNEKFTEFETVAPDSKRIAFIYAEVLPREWRDIRSCQRRLIFRVGIHDDSNGRHIEWVEDTPMLARWDGLHVSDWP